MAHITHLTLYVWGHAVFEQEEVKEETFKPDKVCAKYAMAV